MLKTSNSKLLKIAIVLILLFITLYCVLQPVLAASGTKKYAAGQFASYMFTTDNSNTPYGVVMRKLVDLNTNESKTVFCAEHGLDIITGVIHTGTYYTPTDETVKSACKVAYFGWYSKYGSYVINGGMTTEEKKDYVYTQQFIWEVLGQSTATFTNSTYQSEYEAFKNEINNKIANMKIKPSFSDSTITLDVGETTTLTDNNGVLADYSSVDKTINGIRFVHNKGENTLTITVNSDCEIEDYKITDSMTKEWGLIKEQTKDNDTTIYISFTGDVQDQLYSFNYNDPVTLAMRLKINLLGNMEISKLDTEGNLVDGSKIRVTGDNYNQLVEVKNGKIVIENLKKRFLYTKRRIFARRIFIKY